MTILQIVPQSNGVHVNQTNNCGIREKEGAVKKQSPNGKGHPNEGGPCLFREEISKKEYNKESLGKTSQNGKIMIQF